MLLTVTGCKHYWSLSLPTVSLHLHPASHLLNLIPDLPTPVITLCSLLHLHSIKIAQDLVTKNSRCHHVHYQFTQTFNNLFNCICPLLQVRSVPALNFYSSTISSEVKCFAVVRRVTGSNPQLGTTDLLITCKNLVSGCVVH